MKFFNKVIAILNIIILLILVMFLIGLPKTNPNDEQKQPTKTINNFTVLESIRNASQLATVEYNFYQEKVVKENPNNPFTLKRIIVVTEAQIKGGIDLQKLTVGDINVNNKSITIKVPKSEILSVDADPSKMKVLDEDYGPFNKLTMEETKQYLEDARNVIKQKAIDEHIIDKADEQTKLVLTNLLKAMGFDEVQIETKQ
jgi:hypothetical protein